MARVALQCPACRGTLAATRDALTCSACQRDYPIIAGIPDLRLDSDPYIGIGADREKAAHLARAAATRSFDAMLRYYYDITPEDPPDLAARWTARALVEVEIGESLLEALPWRPEPGGLVVDLGCGTAGLTVALARRGWPTVGVDIGLRWLVVAQQRLRETGSSAQLVCASARRLPFGSGTARGIIANDLIEHVDEPREVVREMGRALAAGAPIIITANNRFAPLPEPQMRLWGVGYLPRRWQRRYVSWRRQDTHPYRIALPSARELSDMLTRAGFIDVRTAPAPLIGPHVAVNWIQSLTRVYNRARRWPISRLILRWAGPRVMASGRRAAEPDRPA